MSDLGTDGSDSDPLTDHIENVASPPDDTHVESEVMNVKSTEFSSETLQLEDIVQVSVDVSRLVSHIQSLSQQNATSSGEAQRLKKQITALQEEVAGLKWYVP